MLGVLTQTIDNETHNIINLRNEIINTPLKCISKLGHFDAFCSPETSPESRRKIARAKFLLEIRSRREIWCNGSIRDGFWGLQSPQFIAFPWHHISSKNLPICNSLWVTTHSHQVLAVSSINLLDFSMNLVLGWGVVLKARENGAGRQETGFYGFRRVVGDIAMRHCQNGIVARQGRTVLEAFCSFFFLCDYDMRLWHFVIVAWQCREGPFSGWTQNYKVVVLSVSFPEHLESHQSEFGWVRYARNATVAQSCQKFFFCSFSSESVPTLFLAFWHGYFVMLFLLLCLWIEYELAPFLPFDSRMSILNACTHIS